MGQKSSLMVSSATSMGSPASSVSPPVSTSRSPSPILMRLSVAGSKVIPAPFSAQTA